MDQPIQLALLAAGCQPWNSQVTAASGKRFAYCATSTVYIFEADEKTGQYVLHSIFAENKQRITCMCWHPSDPNLLCTTSCNGTVIIWDVEQQKVFKQIKYPRDKPVSCCFYSNCLAFATKSVAVNLWEYNSRQAVHTPPSYNCSFSSDVTIIKFCSPGESGKKHVSILDEDNEEDNGYESLVTDIQWDPHSTEYALVSRYQCGLIMMDTNNMSVLMRYSMPSRAVYVQCLAWVPAASGTFVTGDQQNGILRIWNVSKAEPLESLKIKTTGFHAMSALQRQTAGISTDSVTTRHQGGPGVTPPVLLVCTFSDGGVGLYDLSLRRWSYLREKGHTETVFDCKFSTSDATRLATASFDGSVKVWDASRPELKFECSSPGNEGILYQISWAPSNLNCIAVASAKHGMFIWNISKGKITHRYHEHGHEVCVYTVCWNQIDSTRILTGGADGYAVVRQIDEDGVVRFDHNGAAVYGCEWSPSDQSLFVTGAEDGKVRVFCQPLLGQQGNADLVCKPVRVFEGHSSKSFHVKFSPLRDGYLASGSDDSTIRIWSYGEAKCTQVLTGHKSNVRGLCWSPEIAYLLYSGSWDYSIILWDIRNGSKLCTLDGHSGDVYGLSIHKNRPFILASSSRDSTVRLWSTYQVVSSLPIAVLAKVSWSEVFATPRK
ncbi:WDR17 [Bugula neritina]|uniref:WDR17 n=1 Tax=Bugula neritina TaxID=10212 RepID=A0A7J7IVL8_BUGNE|nr:WDR17 [Bugula neritina]